MVRVGIVVALAGLLAAAVAGSATGVQVPEPPAAYSTERNGPSNAPRGPAFRTVAALRVPQGTYAVNAKSVIITSRTSGADCYLFAGRRNIDISNQPLHRASATARSTLVTQYTGAVGADEPLRLRCRTGTTWTATNSKITAIRVSPSA
jgi:hypothetical protein